MKIKSILFKIKAMVSTITILLCWAGYLLAKAIDGTVEAFVIGLILGMITTIIIGGTAIIAAVLSDGDDEDGEKNEVHLSI